MTFFQPTSYPAKHPATPVQSKIEWDLTNQPPKLLDKAIRCPTDFLRKVRSGTVTVLWVRFLGIFTYIWWIFIVIVGKYTWILWDKIEKNLPTTDLSATTSLSPMGNFDPRRPSIFPMPPVLPPGPPVQSLT